MVVGWGADDVLVATFDDQQMSVLDAGDELHALTALAFIDGLGEVLIEIIDEHAGVLCLQIATVMGDDLTICERDDITADGEVVISHLIAY